MEIGNGDSTKLSRPNPSSAVLPDRQRHVSLNFRQPGIARVDDALQYIDKLINA